jgi:O-antigen ligase
MRWDIKLVLTAAWAAAGTCGYLIVPESAPFLLPLAVLAPLLWTPREGLAARLWGRSLLARVLAVASAYLLINASWSTDPTLAYIGVATFFVASVVLHIVITTVSTLDREPVRAMAIGFFAGFVISAFLVSIEVVLKHPLHLQVFAAFPALTPQVSGSVVEAGILKSLPSHFLNRHIAALTFLIWPALLIAGTLASSSRARIVLLTCLVPVIPAVFASDHESSKVALAGGVAAFCVLLLTPRLGKPLLAAAWILACVAVVPLAHIAYDRQLHKADWLQPSAQQRIVIWGVTSAKVAEAPLFGHGLVAARALGRKEKESPKYEAGSPYMVSTGPHAHNVYLQVWFDSGLVGIALMVSIGLFALTAISRVARAHQPALYAAFATGALMAASSFSIWTRWFLASYALAAIFAVLAAKFATTAREGIAEEARPLVQDKTPYSSWPNASEQAVAKHQRPVLNLDSSDTAPKAALRRSH